MTTAIEVVQPGGHVATLTAEQIKAQVALIQRVMKGVMKKDTHYGIIPGTQKPTLYKAGSEVLLTTFRVSVEPDVTDLSTADEVRYRVRAVGRHQTTGIVVGIGLGEASSNEEKYRWRNAVCQEEFDETPEDRRRAKWQKYDGKPSQRQQVRTSPSDVANTVLKMAKKRAQIDLTLTALAASDIFTQDVEDMSEEIRDAGADAARSVAQGKPATEPPKSTGNGTRVATEKQVKLLSSRLDAAGVPENAFCKHYDITDLKQLPFERVDEALNWVAKVHA